MTSIESSGVCYSWVKILFINQPKAKEDKPMILKEPIYPERVRQVPRQFSWLDQRLIRDHYLDHCSHPAAALYLFLVAVGDARGLSYYSDASVMKRLSMDDITLKGARQNLIANGLIAWQKPLYQALELGIVEKAAGERAVMDKPLSLGEILKRAMGGTT